MTIHFGNIACNARATAVQMSMDCWSQQYAGFDSARYIAARFIWQSMTNNDVIVGKHNVEGANELSDDYALGMNLKLDAIDEHEISKGGLA